MAQPKTMKNLNLWGLAATTLLLIPQAALGSSASPLPRELCPRTLQDDEAGLADQVQDIIDDHDAAMEAFWVAYEAFEAKGEGEGSESSPTYPDTAPFHARLLVLVDGNPKHPASLTAIAWMFQNGDVGEERGRLLELLLEHHNEGEAIRGVCGILSFEPSPDVEQFLRKLKQISPSHAVVGHATFALAVMLGRRLDLYGEIAALRPEEIEGLSPYYDEATVESCRTLDPEVVRAERRQLFETVRDDFEDVDTGGFGTTLAQAARNVLFELDHLQIGMVAPEISGPDLDGVEFRLSDYRGKVVLLDFWGDW